MHRNDVHHASPGRPTCPRPLRHTSTSLPLLCHNYDGTQIATPTKYARQLLCHSIRLRRTPHSPTSPRGASLPLWLYKLSPCAGCASHANQISVGLIKNRSRDLQASQYCAQLSSVQLRRVQPKSQQIAAALDFCVCSEFNFVLSCCRHVWLLHVV